MVSPVESVIRIREQDLHHWNKLQVFQEVLEKVFARAELSPTFAHPRRTLGYASYLSLFLFGLFNPVVQSMRGLCAISALERVQEEVGCPQVSLGSFSETQAVLDPALLEQVFLELVQRTQTQASGEDPRLAKLRPMLQDGSLWRALPRMGWAQYGVGSDGQAKGVRLHLRFNLVEDKPAQAKITPGRGCERKALRQMLQPGQTTVGDRLYGEDYRLFAQVDQAGAFFVFRIKESASIHWEEPLAVSAADRRAGVVRQGWARLGATPALLSMRLRVVEIRCGRQHRLLVTNLSPAQAPAELIELVYRRRWAIELFFRWMKCILGMRHFFAESPQGVSLQMYLALIASLLFQMYTGRRPNKRIMELIQFYLLGWVAEPELLSLLAKHLARQSAGKKA